MSKIKIITKVFRRGQDSNLCGETPIDFESIALTTRPPRLCSLEIKIKRNAEFRSIVSQNIARVRRVCS